jgi:hypothetical protein
VPTNVLKKSPGARPNSRCPEEPEPPVTVKLNAPVNSSVVSWPERSIVPEAFLMLWTIKMPVKRSPGRTSGLETTLTSVSYPV